MDEAKVVRQKYIYLLVGSLDTSNERIFSECLPLENKTVTLENISSIILHTVDELLQKLEIKHENIAFLFTGVAWYMSWADKIVRELYSNLKHVTCIAHFLPYHTTVLFEFML